MCEKCQEAINEITGNSARLFQAVQLILNIDFSLLTHVLTDPDFPVSAMIIDPTGRNTTEETHRTVIAVINILRTAQDQLHEAFMDDDDE